MAKERGAKKISELDEALDFSNIAVDDGTPIGKRISKDRLKNLMASEGVQLKAVQGGTVGSPTSLVDPETNEYRWMKASPGEYTFGGSPYSAQPGKEWIFEWVSETWSLKDMGALPTTPITEDIKEGNPLPPSADATARQTMLNKKFVFVGEEAIGKNLFDKTKVRPNFWLNTSTGAIEPVVTNHSISGYIPVRANQPYTESGGYGNGSTSNRIAVFENIGDTIPVQYVTSTNNITPNIDGFVVIMTGTDASNRIDTLQFEQGTVASPYEPFVGQEVERIYDKFLPKKISEIVLGGSVVIGNEGLIDGDTAAKAINPLSNILSEITVRENYFDKTKVINGQLLNVPSGTPAGKITIGNAATYNRSYPELLPPGDYKILGLTIGNNNIYAGLSDTPLLDASDSVYLDRVYGNTFSISTPRYLSFTVKSPSLTVNLDTVQVKKINASDEYAPYDRFYINPDAITVKGDQRGELEVYVAPTYVRVRTSYDSTNDLVNEYQYKNYPTTNGVFSGKSVFLVPKSVSIVDDLTSYLAHDINDSISPMGTLQSQYWFIAGQHGYYIARATSSGNTFTVGQQVKDPSGREFTVIHKDGTLLYLAPKITVSGNTITRSWSQGGSSFASLSTLDDSYSNPVSAVSGYQLKPMMVVNKQDILIDGAKVVDTGVYRANSVELIDSADCINPIGATFNGISGMTGNVLMNITQSYFFKGKSVYLSCNLNMADNLPFIKYHGIQPLGLMPTGSFTPYAIIPKVKPQPLSGSLQAVDWNYPVDINDPSKNKYSKYLFAVNTTDLIDVNDIPDRTIQYLKDGSDNFKLGFASGLDLETGLTAKGLRDDYVTEAFEMATNVSNKLYFRVLMGTKFPNNVLPSSFIGQFNSYFSYYKPKVGIQSYVVHAKDISYIYIHTQEIFTKESVSVDLLDGQKLAIVEQKGITLKTDRVLDGKVFVQTSNSSSNYIVLKTV